MRKIPLNKVPFVPNNEPLLGILDKFQEGRSHMAIVRYVVLVSVSIAVPPLRLRLSSPTSMLIHLQPLQRRQSRQRQGSGQT